MSGRSTISISATWVAHPVKQSRLRSHPPGPDTLAARECSPLVRRRWTQCDRAGVTDPTGVGIDPHSTFLSLLDSACQHSGIYNMMMGKKIDTRGWHGTQWSLTINRSG